MIKKNIGMVLLLVFGTFVLQGGDFYIVKGNHKIKADTYNSQSEFVQIMKKHMASTEEIKEESKGIYGLMFFYIAAPKETVMVGKVEKRMMEFYNFPGNFDFQKEVGDKLYGTKDELLKSEGLQEKIKQYGHTEVFIIGIDVKFDRMHSISKPNGQRIFLDSWYKE